MITTAFYTKKKAVTTLCLLTTLVLSAQSPSFQWARSMESVSGTFGCSVAADASGNVYTAGYFSGTADFDPGPGTYYLSADTGVNTFISKLDVAGNFLWAKHVGGNSSIFGMSITTDVWGNVCATGYFQGKTDFDPGAATFLLDADKYDALFILKLDPSGNFLWAKSTRNVTSSEVRAYAIATDAVGNFYVTGTVQGAADFDPGAGTAQLTSAGSYDAFALKLDVSGNFEWVKGVGGTSGDEAQDIAVDASGNVYIAGWFAGTADFNPGIGTDHLTASGFNDIFVLKLDVRGNFAWARIMGGETSRDEATSVATDAGGNAYITGSFNGTGDFDPGSATYTLTSAGFNDLFITKLDASGNFLWAKAMGGIAYDRINSIATDASGNVYTTGYFCATADFDPDNGVYYLNSQGSCDLFILKLDASGSFVWATPAGGISNDEGFSVCTDKAGNVYTTGWFRNTVDFDPGTGSYDLSVAGAEANAFVHKMSQETAGIDATAPMNGIRIYPNPAKDVFHITLSRPVKQAGIEIYNGLGDLVYKQASLSETITTLDLSPLDKGFYFIKIMNDNQVIATGKLIRQ